MSIPVSLQSFPAYSVDLPRDSELLLPRAGEREEVHPLQIRKRLRHALSVRLSSLKAGEKRVLLVLPDHTRRSEASHLAIDTLLALVDSRPDLSLTVVFGLGSHPPMGLERIGNLLGVDRLLALQQRSIPILEQTTLQPLPSRSLNVAKPAWIGPGTLRLDLPSVLWESHLIVVAGNTELHPYESRSGSGGLHKMLVIGLGNQSIIHHTHDIHVLTDPAVKRRLIDSRFVQLLDYYAKAIIQALLSSHLGVPPLGFSVVCLEPSDSAVHGVWIGEKDAERVVLTSQLHQERTCRVGKPLDFVISDPEISKSTDLLAGCRSLHLLCAADHPRHPVLSRSSPLRTAFLFNTCHEVANADGIGNRGTKRHLDVLAECIQAELMLLTKQPGCTARLMKQSRNRVLTRWYCYLRLMSIQDDFLLSLSKLAQHVQSLGTANNQCIEVQKKMYMRLNRYKDIPGILGRRIRSLMAHCMAANWSAVQHEASDWRESLSAYAFAEGGQRALRFLLILQRFERFVIATDNPAVIAYLEMLSPDLRHLKSPSWFKVLPPDSPFRLDLLGVSGLDLRQQSPSQALQSCYTAHQLLRGCPRESSCGFIQNPILLEPLL